VYFSQSVARRVNRAEARDNQGSGLRNVVVVVGTADLFPLIQRRYFTRPAFRACEHAYEITIISRLALFFSFSSSFSFFFFLAAQYKIRDFSPSFISSAPR